MLQLIKNFLPKDIDFRHILSPFSTTLFFGYLILPNEFYYVGNKLYHLLIPTSLNYTLRDILLPLLACICVIRIIASILYDVFPFEPSLFYYIQFSLTNLAIGVGIIVMYKADLYSSDIFFSKIIDFIKEKPIPNTIIVLTALCHIFNHFDLAFRVVRFKLKPDIEKIKYVKK